MPNFDQKHAGYASALAARRRAMDLYEGGARVEQNNAYLVRHPYETEAQYEIRKIRAVYRNLAAPIVDVFASYICDKRPSRILPKELEPMIQDVDRRQTSADVFFANQARLAAAGGTSFVLCDMERKAGSTLAEDLKFGRRLLPYFVAVNPDDVYDWHMDEHGIVWAVVHGVEMVSSEPFSQPQMRDTLTVWTRRQWRKYVGASYEFLDQARSPGAELANMFLEAEGEHKLGEVPLVPLLFEPAGDMIGNPVTDDVLSLILRVYRRDSEYDKTLFDCAVPLAIINGLSVEDAQKFIRSSSNVLVSSGMPGIDGKYLEPTGQSSELIREALENDIRSIREIALRMVRPDSAQAISAESKSIDKQQLDTQLANFARRCANSERKCFELAYKWLHGGQATPEISTPYNEDYSLGEMEKLDRAYSLEMYRSGAISKEAYLGFLKKLNVIGEDFDIEAELVRSEGELKAAAGPSGIAGIENRSQSLLDLAGLAKP